MKEAIIAAVENIFGADGGTFSQYLVTLIISALPIVELRGGIPYALLKYHLPVIPTMIVSFIGNMLPIPILLIFVKKILNWMGKYKIFKPFVNWVMHRGEKKVAELKEKQSKWEEWALMIFVAIPAPGTGGWTGSLVASLLNMDNKKAFKVIAAGVFVADIVVTLIVEFGTVIVEFFKSLIF